MLPTKFRFIWQCGFTGEESKKSANQKQESPVVAMFVMDRDGMRNLYRGSSIDASYHVSDHLAKRFQRNFFFINRLIRNKNCLWWPCLYMDQDKISTLYRGPPIDASYQVSVHLAKWLQRRII
jgi:hypothetical protein